MHGHVAQIEDVVDHALLVLEQLVVVRDHVLDLFFGHVLALVGVLDAEQARQPFADAEVNATKGEAIFWNTMSGPATILLTRSASGQRDALRHQLAHHDAEV